MSMQDHYVEVRADRGSALVVMRFSDAMAVTAGVDVQQIHRSHWVARDMVEDAGCVDGNMMLRMRDGAMLRVSRSFAPTTRGAGPPDRPVAGRLAIGA